MAFARLPVSGRLEMSRAVDCLYRQKPRSGTVLSALHSAIEGQLAVTTTQKTTRQEQLRHQHLLEGKGLARTGGRRGDISRVLCTHQTSAGYKSLLRFFSFSPISTTHPPTTIFYLSLTLLLLQVFLQYHHSFCQYSHDQSEGGQGPHCRRPRLRGKCQCENRTFQTQHNADPHTTKHPYDPSALSIVLYSLFRRLLPRLHMQVTNFCSYHSPRVLFPFTSPDFPCVTEDTGPSFTIFVLFIPLLSDPNSQPSSSTIFCCATDR